MTLAIHWNAPSAWGVSTKAIESDNCQGVAISSTELASTCGYCAERIVHYARQTSWHPAALESEQRRSESLAGRAVSSKR
mmetsp:Transcript_23393/g.43035  ORF Transcript_23393/g.43035 Transcript_23393/m.43035 type:complete len:80 (-) Transcript_23393:22-261(-)